MNTACAFPDGVLHDHGNSQCHAASYQAGAVDALREAADELKVSIDAPRPDDIDAERGRRIGMEDAVTILRTRADQIARGKSVTS